MSIIDDLKSLAGEIRRQLAEPINREEPDEAHRAYQIGIRSGKLEVLSDIEKLLAGGQPAYRANRCIERLTMPPTEGQ